MRTPFIAIVLVTLAGSFASQAQVASSPSQLVHPILKNPNRRNAPTSLDQDPSLAQDPGSIQPRHRAPSQPAALQPTQPGVIVPQIDTGLAASKLTLIGTVKGIKGTMYVTNLGLQEITPMVKLAICDQNGIKLGLTSKTGSALAPNADEKIVILATNLNATDLKLMRLTTVITK